jgi:hypothetical protein
MRSHESEVVALQEVQIFPPWTSCSAMTHGSQDLIKVFSVFWEYLTSMYREVYTNSRIIRCSFAGTRAVLHVSRKMLQTSQNKDLQNGKIADSNGPNTQLIYAGNYTQILKIIPFRIH